MSAIMKKVMLLLVMLLVVGAMASAQAAALPIKVSENGRYFVDQNGTPVFWLGTTQWQLFHGYTPGRRQDHPRRIQEATASPSSRSSSWARRRHEAQRLRPEALDQQRSAHAERGVFQECGCRDADGPRQQPDHLADASTISLYRKHITLENARAWAKWLAQRYKDAPNIVWTMTPEAKQEFVPILRELAAGLREGDGGRHLDQLQARSLALLLQLPPRRELAGFQLDADLERRQADLSDGDPRLQSQAGQAGSDGRRRLRGGLRIRIRGHAVVGSPAGLLFVSRRRLTTPTGTTTVGACCPPGRRP